MNLSQPSLNGWMDGCGQAVEPGLEKNGNLQGGFVSAESTREGGWNFYFSLAAEAEILESTHKRSSRFFLTKVD